MQARNQQIGAALAVAVAFALPARAELSAGDVAKLGTTLTPVGAEKAGNAAGTIPAWDGGITRAPGDYKPGHAFPNPYAADKPSFTISAQNADQYRANLTEGQLAMLKKYPDYK